MAYRASELTRKANELVRDVFRSPLFIRTGEFTVIEAQTHKVFDLMPYVEKALASEYEMQAKAAASRGAIVKSASVAAESSGKASEVASAKAMQEASEISAVITTLQNQEVVRPNYLRWALVVGVVGGGAYLLFRRRRRK